MSSKFATQSFAALSVLLLLTACGGEVNESSSSSKDAMKVAILTSGPVNDNGYNADAQRTIDLMEEQLDIEVSLSESVPIPNQADVYRQFASQGYDLVIGWGGQYSDGAVEVGKSFPEVNFLVVNSSVENGSNVGSLDTEIEGWQFLVGWLQAKTSETGTVGWIGAQCFPATAANLHGTEQGAKYADPSIEILSTFTGDFEDPTSANQAAQAMIETGADVLSGNLNSAWSGVIQAAQANDGVTVITEWADNHETAPTVISSSVLKSQAPFVIETVKSVQDGTFSGGAEVFSLPEDWGPVLADTDLVPEELYEEALKVQDQVTSGEIKIEHDETCE